MTLITLALVTLVVIYMIFIYNRLIGQIEAIRNNQKQIDIQLDRRYKVFESLINGVKQYMDYEKTTLKEVVALRNTAQAAHGKGEESVRMEAENKISSIASNLNVVFEQYPDLKANQNCMQLQEEIVNTENKLAFSKQSLNDSIELYNANKKSFPTNVLVNLFKSALDFTFDYWQLSSDKIQQHENYTVKF